MSASAHSPNSLRFPLAAFPLAVLALSAVLCPIRPVHAADKASFVQIKGDQFVYRGKVVKLKGTNYYPRDYMWAEMWKADPSIIAQDAVRIRGLGLNCVRILVPYSLGGWKGATPPQDRLDMLVKVVNIFGQQGIRSVVTLFDWETSFPAQGTPKEGEHLSHLNAIVMRLKDNPYVLLWDVKNEPDHPANLDKKSDDWSCCPEKRAQISDWLKRMCHAVRERDRNHPVSAGMRWADNVKDVLDFVDVAIFHSYWKTIDEKQIPTVQQAMGAKVKPILVEEFGWPSHPSPCERETGTVTDYTEQDQLRMLDLHLRAFEKHNIAGGLQWMTHDAAKYSNDRKDSFEKYFGFWRYDGSIKAGTLVYQKVFKVKPFPRER